jgi:aminoglycoside 6-adenylyltransferase
MTTFVKQRKRVQRTSRIEFSHITRRLKRWVRPDLWAELEKTYTGPDLDAKWDAMFRLIDLFRRVAIEVGDFLGFTYPSTMDQRAVAYLQRVRNLDRDAETFT